MRNNKRVNITNDKKMRNAGLIVVVSGVVLIIVGVIEPSLWTMILGGSAVLGGFDMCRKNKV